MAGKMYDDDMLKNINESVDLLEYVSQSIDMEKRGRDYFGHCPLHTDKTPSFSITPETNAFYCFSCGRSGGIIGYLIDYEKLAFDQAVEKAAKLANVDLGKMCRSETISFLKKARNALEIHRTAYDHMIIPESEYQQYRIGNISEWTKEGIQPSVLRKFDIRIDDRQNRIVYAVRDIEGRLINIKARTRYENYKRMGIPKYINYYPIGVMDYFQSLDMAKPYVIDSGEIIVFESIKSTMKAYGWGYKNCVSAEKHTLTPEQISLLIRLNVNVVLAYDSDVSYRQPDVKKNLDILRRTTNTYIITDANGLLGGIEAKNAPVDLGRQIWEELYDNKKKVV